LRKEERKPAEKTELIEREKVVSGESLRVSVRGEKSVALTRKEKVSSRERKEERPRKFEGEGIAQSHKLHGRVERENEALMPKVSPHGQLRKNAKGGGKEEIAVDRGRGNHVGSKRHVEKKRRRRGFTMKK